jgi:ribose-phosphate pyrophosphokinase
MIKYEIGNLTAHVRQWFFPDGCVGTNINIGEERTDPERYEITVTLVFGSSDENGKKFSINDDIMALAQTVDALKIHYPMATLYLVLPYIPYARQDRACSPGDSFSLRVVAKMINALGFGTVTVADPHSGVAGALIDNMYDVHQYEFFHNVRDFSDVYIVAPDQGASKKCEEFAKRVGALGVITCAKVREMSTGKILGLKVIDEIPDAAKLFVLDDICDGGRTFIEVSKALQMKASNSGNGHIAVIELAVTHGLFTKGVDALSAFYDRIYTTNSVISEKEGCTVIDIL